MEAARDTEPADDAPARLTAASRAFRSWALDHRAEFGLLFGSPIPGIEVEKGSGEPDDPARDAGTRFGQIFGDLIARIYLERPFPTPADEELDPVLRAQLADWTGTFPVPLPLGVAQVFLSCWIRLYGMVAMEVFGHLAFALTDAEAMFETELAGLGDLLGLHAEHPARG